MAGEGSTTSAPVPVISIVINLGPLSIKYDGPPEFLDKLPGIITELGKFEALLQQGHTATAPPAP